MGLPPKKKTRLPRHNLEDQFVSSCSKKTIWNGTIKTHLDRLWHAADLLFLTGLAVSMLLGGKVTPLLVVAGVLPIPFLLQKLKSRHYHVPLWRLLAPFGIYFAYSLFTLVFFTGLEASDPHPVNPSLESYAIAIAMLAVGLVRGLQVTDLASLFRRVMPGCSSPASSSCHT